MVYDPEDPRCARLTLTGKMVEVAPEELMFAKEAMFSRLAMLAAAAALFLLKMTDAPSCPHVLLDLPTDTLWWPSGQWDTSGSSWRWSWSRSGCRTGSEERRSFLWRTTSKLRPSENAPPPRLHCQPAHTDGISCRLHAESCDSSQEERCAKNIFIFSQLHFPFFTPVFVFSAQLVTEPWISLLSLSVLKSHFIQPDLSKAKEDFCCKDKCAVSAVAHILWVTILWVDLVCLFVLFSFILTQILNYYDSAYVCDHKMFDSYADWWKTSHQSYLVWRLLHYKTFCLFSYILEH